jgi:signal transduction histidine kinase
MPVTGSRGVRYSLGAISPLLAFFLTWGLSSWVTPIIFPLFLAAVALTGWYGGAGPGLVSILLSSVASLYLLRMPQESLALVTPYAQLALFVVAATLILAVTGYRHREQEDRYRLWRAQSARGAAEAESRNLRALNDISLALSSSLSLAEVLQQIVDLSRQLLDARYAALGVFDEEGRITQFITSGIDAEVFDAIGHLPEGKGLLGYLMRDGRPLRVEDIQAHPASVGFPPHHPPMKTLLGIPLRYKGELLGDLYLTEKVGGAPFTASDEELLLLFGAHAAAALANARLAQRIEGLAVIEERQRIGMELHDSIIQSIYAVGLSLQIVTHTLQEAPPIVDETLQRAIDGLHQVMRDIRAYIANLAPDRLDGKRFSQGLHDLAREVRMSGQMEVHVQVAAEVDDWLEAQQSMALFQVVREALSNTIKHAGASAATVRAGLDERDALCLTIQDNGVGFAIPEDGFDETHHGLRNMHQRLYSMGGSLDLNSVPGHGTTLRVHLPFPSPGRNHG